MNTRFIEPSKALLLIFIAAIFFLEGCKNENTTVAGNIAMAEMTYSINK